VTPRPPASVGTVPPSADPPTDIELSIQTVVYEGHALGRLDGLVVFVDGGALPGERVQARIVRRAARHAWAVLTGVIEPSPQRRPAPCPVFGTCGGCQFLNWQDAAQIEAKRQFVRDGVRSLPDAPDVDPTIASEEPLFFRNKMSFSTGWRDGRPVCGLHERGRPDAPCSASDCVLQSEASQRIVRMAEDLGDRPGPGRVEVREGRRTGERMILLDQTSPGFNAAPWAEALGDLCTTLLVTPADGGAPRALIGTGRLREVFSGLSWEIGPRDFFQTNTAQAERMFGHIAEIAAAAAPRRALDLYAGTGAITAVLARVAGEAIGVESHGPSVDAARRNAAATPPPLYFGRTTQRPETRARNRRRR